MKREEKIEIAKSIYKRERNKGKATCREVLTWISDAEEDLITTANSYWLARQCGYALGAHVSNAMMKSAMLLVPKYIDDQRHTLDTIYDNCTNYTYRKRTPTELILAKQCE